MTEVRFKGQSGVFIMGRTEIEVDGKPLIKKIDSSVIQLIDFRSHGAIEQANKITGYSLIEDAK